MKIEILSPFEKSGFGNIQTERLTLEPGEEMPLAGYPEERMYYLESGYGMLSVYEEPETGDLYMLRPCVSLFFTPGLCHYIKNNGHQDLVMVLFRITGGKLPAGTQDGVQTWSNMEKDENVGCGFWYTDIFNVHENETVREGVYLDVWGMLPRRPQKFDFGEMLRIAPGGTTRPHTHGDIDETFYFVNGEGVFMWDDQEIAFKAGDVITCPRQVLRRIRNTGKGYLLYMCISSRA